MFVISLSSYDQKMAEDPTINRMADSLVLFEKMSNSKMLVKKSICLLLNKKDLYETKIRTIPLIKFFPDYKGNENSISQGLELMITNRIKYFDQKFRSLAPKNCDIETHVTQATDTATMSVVISNML